MESEIITAYVGIGSNLGDRAGNLLLALRGLMEASFSVHKVSAIYETEPVGVEGHGKYLNIVAEIRLSGITPSQTLARLLRIEYLLGRRDKNLKMPRTVDIDLLLFGSYVCSTEFLILPHPRMHERRFVLQPLDEIAPHIVHPILHKDVRLMLETLKDAAEVKRWNPNAQPVFENDEAKIYVKSWT